MQLTSSDYETSEVATLAAEDNNFLIVDSQQDSSGTSPTDAIRGFYNLFL